MNRIAGIFCAAGLLAGAALQAQETAAAKNPAAEKFADSIVFYAGMNGTANAEISVADGKPSAAPPASAFVPGLYGTALQAGDFELTYLIPASERMTRAGAAAVWVAFAPGARAVSPPYYFPFLTLSGNGRSIMLGRLGNIANGEMLYVYLKDDGQKGVYPKSGSTLGWKEREWHLLVMNWRSDSADLSVDGQTPVRAHLQNAAPEPAAEKLGDERLQVSSRAKKLPTFILDEVMLFDAPLTPEEIQSLYETSRKK